MSSVLYYKTIDQLLFFRAIQENNLRLVQHLVARGVDINAKNSNGLTGLHVAVDLVAMDILDYLISKKADILIEDPQGKTFAGRIFKGWDMKNRKNIKLLNMLRDKILKSGYPKEATDRLLKL